MANWKNKLDLKEFYKPYEGRQVTNEEAHLIGVGVSKKIREHKMYNKHKLYLEPLCKGFSRVRSQEGFNKVMAKLYDWADYDANCWIESFW
jgi:hypothetical protein